MKQQIRSYRRTTPFACKSCDPTVAILFAAAHDQRISTADLAERSGINRNTLKDWRIRTTPRIADLRAVLNVLGLDIHIIKLRLE